jgi:hypothetical protein
MKEEYLRKETDTKRSFYFRDDKEGIDVKCREVYKNKKLEVQFPFSKTGGKKYRYIEEIRIEDVDSNFIKGISKSATFGLGFTKYLSPIIYKLEEKPRIKKIVISPTKTTVIKNDTLTFNTVDLEEIFNWLKPLKDSQWQETKKVSNNALAKSLPTEFNHLDDKYNKGEIALFIKNKKVNSSKLSEEDIKQLLEVLPDHITEQSIFYKTEEKINHIRLNAVKADFKKLTEQKSDTKALEEKCHKFFEENNWIFSNILATPIALLKSKAYVGGKSYENTDGKITDFLFKNSLTKNVCVVEIKTPRKKLVDTKVPYRKPDVFSMGKELTGGLVQVLDQKDNLMKEFHVLSSGDYESFSPKALLVIGCLSDLNRKQLKSFELFRGSIKDVEVITYDELLARTELVLGQFVEDK